MQGKSGAGSDDARSKSFIVALDEGHVSFAVDDAQIRRVLPNRHFPGTGVAARLVSFNQFGPVRRPLFRKQRRKRQFLFPRVADIFCQIRVRQLLRLDHGVQRFRRAEAPILLSQRKRLHNVQHFQRRHPLHVRR